MQRVILAVILGIRRFRLLRLGDYWNYLSRILHLLSNTKKMFRPGASQGRRNRFSVLPDNDVGLEELAHSVIDVVVGGDNSVRYADVSILFVTPFEQSV